MQQKIFLVEDEIVAREGIRDAIDWAAAGYHFCGEAADGELALPLIMEQRPDIVITDIKMPFMDGLCLSRIVRERLPDSKIIILSGHDEFRYAQEAIQIGVTEYLLKPISPEALLETLQNVASAIERERQARDSLHRMQQEVDSQRLILLQLLKSGSKATIGAAVDRYLTWLGLSEQGASRLLDYALTDSLLAAASFLRELGGSPATIVPELGQLETLRHQIHSREQLRELIYRVLEAALDYRDGQTRHQQQLIGRAKEYIETHASDPDLSLSAVAAEVTLSPSYFSALFSRQVGQSFVEYLTALRIERAKELLRTTALTSSEIGYRVGYQNPRYFHVVFRKLVGSSPIAFRREAQL